MITRYILVHTWKDTTKTETHGRVCWASKITEFMTQTAARIAMREEFLKYYNDNKQSLICATIGGDDASMKYATDNHEIWTITKTEV